MDDDSHSPGLEDMDNNRTTSATNLSQGGGMGDNSHLPGKGRYCIDNNRMTHSDCGGLSECEPSHCS